MGSAGGSSRGAQTKRQGGETNLCKFQRLAPPGVVAGFQIVVKLPLGRLPARHQIQLAIVKVAWGSGYPVGLVVGRTGTERRRSAGVDEGSPPLHPRANNKQLGGPMQGAEEQTPAHTDDFCRAAASNSLLSKLSAENVAPPEGLIFTERSADKPVSLSLDGMSDGGWPYGEILCRT